MRGGQPFYPVERRYPERPLYPVEYRYPDRPFYPVGTILVTQNVKHLPTFIPKYVVVFEYTPKGTMRVAPLQKDEQGNVILPGPTFDPYKTYYKNAKWCPARNCFSVYGENLAPVAAPV